MNNKPSWCGQASGLLLDKVVVVERGGGGGGGYVDTREEEEEELPLLHWRQFCTSLNSTGEGDRP